MRHRIGSGPTRHVSLSGYWVRVVSSLSGYWVSVVFVAEAVATMPWLVTLTDLT
jgi:hypothetical protein